MIKRWLLIFVLSLIIWPLLVSEGLQAQSPNVQIVGIELPGHTGVVQVVSIGLTPDFKKWNLDRHGNDALGSTKAGHLSLSNWFTPLPGQGNTVIIGHTWHLEEYRYTPFSTLANIPMGSVVRVQTSDGVNYQYCVYSKFEIHTQGTWVIMQKENRLTLITSVVDKDKRLVVFSRPCG